MNTPTPVDLRALMERRTRSDWGPWVLEPDTRVLALYSEHGNHVYEIDLDGCTTSAAILDWLCQVTGKVWATDDVLAGLVRALDDVLQPQGNLCGWGRSSTISRSDVVRLVNEATDRP